MQQRSPCLCCGCVVISSVIACASPGTASYRAELADLDAGAADGANGGSPDAPPDTPPAFAPLHVRPETMIPGPPDLTFDQVLSIFDTTALTINGETSPFFVRQDSYAVLFVNRLTVVNPVLVTGSAPLIVVAYDEIRIGNRFDAGAHGSTPGPGAADEAPGGAGTTIPPADLLRRSSGGGGGGHGTAGAAGGSQSPTTFPPGAGGGTYDPGITGPLRGGSRGGSGGFASGSIGAPGAGGGAVQLSSAVFIAVTGDLTAAGGGGRGGGVGQVGGGGGGSGGEILLEAPTILIGPVPDALTANGGGGGGGGGAGGSIPPPGRDGQDGRSSPSPAAGGAGGVPQGSNGGAGATGTSPAAPGSSANSKGGGGGGGVGRIWLRYRAATPPLIRGVVSPSAELDPTLP